MSSAALFLSQLADLPRASARKTYFSSKRSNMAMGGHLKPKDAHFNISDVRTVPRFTANALPHFDYRRIVTLRGRGRRMFSLRMGRKRTRTLPLKFYRSAFPRARNFHFCTNYKQISESRQRRAFYQHGMGHG